MTAIWKNAYRGGLYLLVCVFALSLAACGSTQQSNCPPGVSKARCRAHTSHKKRAIPRLWTGERSSAASIIDTSSINAPPNKKTRSALTPEYVGSLRTGYTTTKDTMSRDLTEIKAASKAPVNLNDLVTLNFKNVTLQYFLQNTLRGILGVTYIAPSKMSGNVTVTTEHPIPKGQVLQIVRDILARNHYAIKFKSGVYHVGTINTIMSLESSSEIVRRAQLVKIHKGDTVKIVKFAEKILGERVILLPTSDSSMILIQAPSNELSAAVKLVETLSSIGVGEERVAIIPLHRNDPVKIAEQLREFYNQRLGDNRTNEELTIMPLPDKQAILVGTSDRYIMSGLRKILNKLDNASHDEVSLRVIPLVHLHAKPVVEQLNAIFSDATTVSSVQEESKSPNSTSTKGNPDTDQQKSDKGRSVSHNLPISSAIKIVPDVRNNSIFVYSNYAFFSRLHRLLEGIDVPQAQVVIEATIVEVQLNDALEYGVKWFLSGNKKSIPTLLRAFTSTVSNLDSLAIIKALQNVSRIKIISSPYLTVLDNKTARLLIGDQIPFVKTTETTKAAGTGLKTERRNIEIRDTGIKLEVTPKISANNSVTLQINQSISAPRKIEAGFTEAPVITTRSITSDIIVHSGRTVLLAGLIQDRAERTASGIPLLMHIPILGHLFKDTSFTTKRVELIVMITPRVVRHAQQIERITGALRSHMSNINNDP